MAGRDAVLEDDIDEMGGLFLDAKRSAAGVGGQLGGNVSAFRPFQRL